MKRMGAGEGELGGVEDELRMELKESARSRGYGNVSNNTLFIASELRYIRDTFGNELRDTRNELRDTRNELRDTKNMLVAVMVFGFTVLTGIGVAILALL